MQNRTRHIFWLAFIALLTLVTVSVMGFPSSTSVGKVFVKSQNVVVISNGKTLDVGSFGMELKNGDTVVTGESGKAKVIMPSGDEITLAPWAKLAIIEKTTKKALTISTSVLFTFDGKIRAKIRKSRDRGRRFKSANAEINIKGTEFVAEYANRMTTVATLEGLVNMASLSSGLNTDIPPGKMSSVSADGTVLPLSEIAGEILKGVESAGEKLTEEDIAGKKE